MYDVLKFRGNTHNSDGKETVQANQHRRALEHHTNRQGAALRKMLEGWEAYAQAYAKTYGEEWGDENGKWSIGKDFVLGPYWAEVGLAIKRLLDGETGGFDCGSLAANITELIEREGIATDGYSLIDQE